MNTSIERPGRQNGWMVLAVICQCLVALMPVVGVSRTIAGWSVLRRFPGYTTLGLSIAALTAAVLLATVIGLALSRSWGWSLALMVNAMMAGFLALGIITAAGRPSSWVIWELVVVAIVAIVALLLPPVRAHYSRRTTPWVLSWWAQPLNTGIDEFLVHLVAVTHVLLNAVFLLKTLAVFPYSGLMILWPAAGIFVGVKLFRNPKLGRLLTLGWCIFSLIFSISTWSAALTAALHNPNLWRPQWERELLFFCGYCGAVGLYLLLSVLKGWLDDMNGVSLSAVASDG